MGIQDKGMVARFQRTANDRYDEHLDDVKDTVEMIFEDGADAMRYSILTRGVRDTIENDEGRIGQGADGGTMYDEVDSAVHRRGDMIRGEFGWIRRGKRQDYFDYQEAGTHDKGEGEPQKGHNRGVRPMNALLDAAQGTSVAMAMFFPGFRKRDITPYERGYDE